MTALTPRISRLRRRLTLLARLRPASKQHARAAALRALLYRVALEDRAA